jgi:hypothetical protein
MEIAFLMLAEAVETSSSRMLFVFNGGINHLRSPAYPTILPMLAIVGGIRVLPVEAAVPHDFVVRGLAPSGETFMQDLRMPFGPMPLIDGRPDLPVYHNLAINLRGVPIREAGTYTIVTIVDDREIGRIEFVCDNLAAAQNETPIQQEGVDR